VDSPSFEFANNHGGFTNGVFQTNTTVLDISDDATKIMYFSPTFGGFNFALSYAPDSTQDGYSYHTDAGGTNFSNDPGEVQNVFSAALNFEPEYDGLSVASGIGFSEGQWESTGDSGNVGTTWGVTGHLDVSFSGFTIGANGTWRNNWQSASGADLWVAGIGGTYNWDAWTVGLAWSHGDYEYADSGSSSDKIDIIELTGRYDLSDSISLDAMVGYNDMNAGSGTGHNDDKTWEAGVGFYIGF
jgi:outer membrane protein OmpU